MLFWMMLDDVWMMLGPVSTFLKLRIYTHANFIYTTVCICIF